MERLLYDTKSSDVAVAWRAAHCAGSSGALAKQLTRKRLEGVNITRLIDHDYAALLNHKAFQMNKWGILLKGTVVVHSRHIDFLKTDQEILLRRIKDSERIDLSLMVPLSTTTKSKKQKKPTHVYNTTNIELDPLNEDSFVAEFETANKVNKFTTDIRNITLHDNYLNVPEDELLSKSVVGETGNIDLDNAEQIRLVMEMFNCNETAASHNIGETASSSKVDISNQQEMTNADAAPSDLFVDHHVPVDEPPNQSTSHVEPVVADDLPMQKTNSAIPVVELTSQEVRDIRKPKGKKTQKKKTLLIDEKAYDAEVEKLYKSTDKKLFTREDKHGWMSKTNDFEFHGMINSTVSAMFERPLINLHEEIRNSLFNMRKTATDLADDDSALNRHRREQQSMMPSTNAGVADEPSRKRKKRDQSANETDNAQTMPSIDESVMAPASEDPVNHVEPEMASELPEMTSNLLFSNTERDMGDRMSKNEAELLIDEQVELHGSVTLSEILERNQITTRRGICAVFYSVLEKAKSDHIQPVQQHPYGEIHITASEHHSFI